MVVTRADPYGQFNFLVTLGDAVDPASPDGAFTEVSGLDVTIAVVEYRAGNDATNTARKLNGLATYGDVTLRRGLIGSLRLWEWIQATIRGSTDAERSVTITLLDAEHDAVMSWTLRNARPVRHVSGPLRGGSSDVAVEELVIAHEGMDIE
jgi:phage tail-like protein